jgi:cytochrome c peroxidase
MSCSAGRRNATNVIGMAGQLKSLCLRISLPVTSASRRIRDRSTTTRAAPDRRGYRANPDGPAYVDGGVGLFLRKLKSLSGQLNPDSGWIPLAPKFDGKFQVPTLRNVDMRPSPDFVKAYMHNGYFKSLKEVVHFYNTRDVLPQCSAGDHREKLTCWPAPEDSTNLNKRQLGNLKLTDQDEDAIVSFLKTLTDGYTVLNQRAAK